MGEVYEVHDEGHLNYVLHFYRKLVPGIFFLDIKRLGRGSTYLYLVPRLKILPALSRDLLYLFMMWFVL